MKDIKDYLHLYLGCEVEVRKKDRDKKWLRGFMSEISRESNHGDWIEVNFKRIVTILNQEWEERLSNFHNYFIGYDEIKPILRPLSDMTEEEAEDFALLCLNSRHAPKDFITIERDEVQVELHKNDGGNLLDGDVEIYIEVSCRCMDGYVSIMKDGRIGMSDESDTPSEEMKPVDSVEEKILYLLSKHFDLFGLIEAGLAIDKTKL